MDSDTPHGRRLSSEEYERRTIELYSGQPEMPSAEQDRALRRAMLNLTIDHRLGCDFPDERRQALWNVAEEVERHRLRSTWKALLKHLLPSCRASASHGLAADVVAAYGKVLAPDELEQFFGEDMVRRPALPDDR